MDVSFERFRLGKLFRLTASVRERTDLGGLTPVLILVVLVGAIGAKTPDFLSDRAAYAVAIQATPILILSVGMTPVILLAGIDLSVAALSSFCTVLLVMWMPRMGLGGLVAVLILATICGATVGLLHTLTQIPSFVASLGALGIYSGLALQVSHETNEPMGAGYAAISWLNDVYLGLPNGFYLGLVYAAVIALLLRSLTIGRHIYAIGAGEPAALMSGVPTAQIRIAVFAISGLSAAFAGITLVARTAYSSPTLADNFLLPSIAAVVVGGTAVSGGLGGIARSAVGAITVTVITIGLVVVGIDPVLQNIVFGGMIIVAVALTIDRRKLISIK